MRVLDLAFRRHEILYGFRSLAHDPLAQLASISAEAMAVFAKPLEQSGAAVLGGQIDFTFPKQPDEAAEVDIASGRRFLQFSGNRLDFGFESVIRRQDQFRFRSSERRNEVRFFFISHNAFLSIRFRFGLIAVSQLGII